MWKTWTGGPAAGPVAAPSSTGPGQGPAGIGGWHPTILYLLALLAAEVFLLALLSRTILR